MSSQPENSAPLSGQRILVIEDEYYLADDIVRALTTLGARPVGPFGDVRETTQFIDSDVAIDAAVVDINLRGEMIFSLARTLRARKIPFVFTSGYDRTSIGKEFEDIRLWEKPLDVVAMAQDLARLIKSN